MKHTIAALAKIRAKDYVAPYFVDGNLICFIEQ